MIFGASRANRLRLAAGLIWLTACSSAPSATNSAWFTRLWQTDDGLPDNNVRVVVQGPDEYLWIVTPVGLTRFDGVRFDRFPIEKLAGTTGLRIRLCSRTGVLWMVSEDGIVMGLNPDFSVATLPKSGLPPHAPVALVEDADGSLWLGYSGSPWAGYSSAIYRIKNGQARQLAAKQGVPPGRLRALKSDGAGNVWLAKGNQIRVFRNGEFHLVATVRDVQCLAGARHNAVWCVAGAGHLVRYAADGGLEECGVFENPAGATTRALLEDRTGAVWLGTDGNGLWRHTQAGFDKIETSHASIASLAEDREGNIWAGTAGGGLDRVSLSGARLEAGDPALGQIQSLCEDANGRLWGATHNGALVCQINGHCAPVFTNAPFAGSVMCVAADRAGAVWIGTRDGKLLSLANTNYAAWGGERATRSAVFGLLPAANGDLWMVGRHVLSRLQKGQIQEVKLPRRIQRFSAMTEDAAGNLWVGAKGMVLRFDGKDWVDETPRLAIAERKVDCLCATADGSLWISCAGRGLLRFKAGQVEQIGVEQGLCDADIAQMVADDRGWFWFGSDHGIFKVRQRELEQAMADHRVHLRPIVYGRNEGLASLEALFSTTPPYVLPRAIRARNGRVWLLTHAGLVMADPNVLSENSAPPPALFTRVAMDGQTIASYGPVTSTQTAANLQTLRTPLRLPPGHRHLEFDFTAIHLRAPENVCFRYQLAGFDSDWIDAQTRRSADYSRLAAGDYQFRVQACLGDGPWNETPARLAFAVAPFFWQTWWFRLGALLLFTATVIVVARYVSTRRLQAKLRQLEQRAALDKERTRIARDLHDDLGCSLNGMALTLDLMQREPGTPKSQNGTMQRFSTMVREAAQSVDEIVWAINPRNDTLRYLVDYLSQFAVEFLQAADILCLVELPENIPDRVVSPEVRHNLLLVVKEALNNIARHARASEVGLRVTVSETQVAFALEDNGRGFERPPDNAWCDGLRNMRQRMEEIGGQFELASRPGAGTRVAFLYAWPSRS